MGLDKLQHQRLELKYIIGEDVALRIRDFVNSYLELDEYGAAPKKPVNSQYPDSGDLSRAYPVHSLYLDSNDLRLYGDTINGTKNRFKLRLRFYENQREAPVYFEIKRRMNNCILKQRGGVRRDAVDWLLAGHLPEPSHLTSQQPKYLVALQHFCQRMMDLHASPKAHIAYFREAWVKPDDNSVRVTLDREVKCEPEFTARLSTELRRPKLVFDKNVVLELKFTNRYPLWFEDMVRAFGIRQTGAAKYVDGVTQFGEGLFYQGLPRFELTDLPDEAQAEEANGVLLNQLEPLASYGDSKSGRLLEVGR